MAAVWRVAVVHLRYGADAVLAHLVLEANEHAVDISYTRVAVDLQIGVGIGSYEPWAGWAVVVGLFAP